MAPARKGAWAALGAYLLWGLLPVYWKALRDVPPDRILTHRICWSFVFLSVLVLVRREAPTVVAAFKEPKTMRVYLSAAVLLTVNWFTYIWAVNSDRIVEASLGYYINPLVSVALGVVVLRERLRRVQWIAVALAACGVLYLAGLYGDFPWAALVLAATFGLYGLIKKTAPLPALPGLLIETALLTVPAAVYLGQAHWRDGKGFGDGRGGTIALLGFTGMVTALPLLLFSSAARRVSLSTLGLLQYLSPTCGLMLGVLLYGEPFPRPRQVGFAIIWFALSIFWAEGAWHLRRTRRSVATR